MDFINYIDGSEKNLYGNFRTKTKTKTLVF